MRAAALLFQPLKARYGTWVLMDVVMEWCDWLDPVERQPGDFASATTLKQEQRCGRQALRATQENLRGGSGSLWGLLAVKRAQYFPLQPFAHMFNTSERFRLPQKRTGMRSAYPGDKRKLKRRGKTTVFTL